MQKNGSMVVSMTSLQARLRQTHLKTTSSEHMLAPSTKISAPLPFGIKFQLIAHPAADLITQKTFKAVRYVMHRRMSVHEACSNQAPPTCFQNDRPSGPARSERMAYRTTANVMRTLNVCAPWLEFPAFFAYL
jgi:hypothetical protein